MASHEPAPELVHALASKHFTGPEAPCPWDSIDPLTQYALTARAHAILTEILPILTNHGWTPPPTTPAPQDPGNASPCL